MLETDQIERLEKRIEELEAELKLEKSEAKNANRKKNMFLANMSHEIRTPMNSILGIYNILRDSDLTDKQIDLLEIINIASQNLLIIINDILDLSKIEAGQLKLEENPFSLHEEINQVIKLLSLKARGKGIELLSSIDANVPNCIIGDAVRLKQILINLANNGIKFTSEGSVRIQVEMISMDSASIQANKEFLPGWIQPKEVREDQRVLKFSVIDTGIGISPEDQETLFYEFAQLENPLVKRFEGTGLGLSISHNLTRLIRGKIGISSIENKGSTFWFTFLVNIGDDTLLQKTQERKKRKKKSLKPLRVLLVEDNLLNQKFAMTTMKQEGHQVDIAVNGKVALDKFSKNKYDLILMDIAMPVMDGIEASQRIRNLEQAESYHPVKIIAITAHVMVTSEKQCIEAGMNAYLIKPYRPNELLDIIDSFDIQ